MGEIQMTTSEYAFAHAMSASQDARSNSDAIEKLTGKVAKLEKALMSVCNLVLGEFDELAELPQFDKDQVVRAGDIQALMLVIRNTLMEGNDDTE